MKKLLYITNIPSPYRVEFWNELGKYYDVTVWFEARNERNREWNIQGLGANFKYYFLSSITFGMENHLSFEVLKKLRADPFDIYIMGCYSSLTEMLAILWLKATGKKFFLNSDGGFPKKDFFLLGLIKRLFISSANYWLSSGKNCTRYLLYYGAKKERVFEYPFSSVTFQSEGVGEDGWDKEAFKRQYGIKGRVILTVGQFIHRKGIDILLNAYSKVKGEDASLIIVGGGPDENQYRKWIEEYSLENVHLIPFMQRKELIQYYKSADIFVLPTREDIWGLVINEAMAFGLPIITTDRCGAAKDLVFQGKNGFVVNANDENAMLEKINFLLENEETRLEFGRRSKEIIGGYTIPLMTEAHVNIFKKVDAFNENFG